MIRHVLRSVAVALTMLLASCGGGDAGCSGFDNANCTSTPVKPLGDLILVLGASSVNNTGTDTVAFTVTTLDTDRNTKSGQAVTVSVDANAALTVGNTTTDSVGKVTGTVSIGSDRSNRIVTVTASSGSVTKTASFTVTGTRLIATLANSVAPSSGNNAINYRVTDVNSAAMAGQAYTISATGGLPSATGVSDATGAFSYTYTAPSTAGPVTVTAVVAGVSLERAIQVEAVGVVDPAVGPIVATDLSINPKSVGANSVGSTANQAIVRALFVGPENKPIKNVRVKFRLKNENNVGGELTTTTVVKTDENGMATTAYIPGVLASPTNGVTIEACYSLNDFALDQCPSLISNTLTVTSEPISVTIGTNNLLEEGTNKLTYIKRYVVSVVDSSGRAMANVLISPQLVLTHFRKGQWTKGTAKWSLGSTLVCPSEDLNRNAKRDTLPVDEDSNLNGRLDPEPSSVIISGGGNTNASGLAYLQVEYAKSFGSWIDYRIEVSASVSGTEGLAKYVDSTRVLASDAGSLDVGPPFQVSPYGGNDISETGCSNTD
jgi:hypothetical protein